MIFKESPNDQLETTELICTILCYKSKGSNPSLSFYYEISGLNECYIEFNDISMTNLNPK